MQKDILLQYVFYKHVNVCKISFCLWQLLILFCQKTVRKNGKYVNNELCHTLFLVYFFFQPYEMQLHQFLFSFIPIPGQKNVMLDLCRHLELPVVKYLHRVVYLVKSNDQKYQTTALNGYSLMEHMRMMYSKMFLVSI